MDPELARTLDFVTKILPLVTVIVAVTVGGWVATTWLRIKNGYPLESSWGRPMHPSTDKEAMERIKLLTSENAQLRAELGAIKDRLETMERIVTDGGLETAAQIEALRTPRLGKGDNIQ